MSVTFSPIPSLSSFFDTYAKALENHDTKGMAFMYNIPCTMLSDETNTLFNDTGKLEGFFNQGMSYYRQFGIVHARPEIWFRREWTKKIMNVKVNWNYFDQNNQPIYNCDYQYVIKLDKNNQWRIMLSVSVNEKERMEAWQANRSKAANTTDTNA